MTRKTRLKTSSNDVELRYQNWVAQLFGLMMPWCAVGVLGRGSAKTTQIISERVKQAVRECPGAPFAWLSDTYSDLHKNIIPTLLEGLRFIGWEEGIHYVIDKEPPEDWKGRMYNICDSWKNTMTFYTGFSFTFISLDRPAIGAGRSFVGIFGDEVKYWPEEKFTNVLKTVRGFRAKYSENPWYRSRTFFTDMPNPNHLGEYSWILKYAKTMDKDRVLLLLKVSFVYNETKKTYAAYIQKMNEEKDKLRRGEQADDLSKLQYKIDRAASNMECWRKRWVKARRRVTLFMIGSSFVNADILGEEFYEDEFNESLEGFDCNILSIIPKLSASEKFYCTMSINNFYADGYITEKIASHPYGWSEDCTVLRYLKSNEAIDGGMDAGNMLSLVFGQQFGRQYRIIKELYSLPPDNERQLANQFIDYFKPHKNKLLRLYYDRSMNNYKRVSNDMATKIKACIEIDEFGHRTGWRVQLMSLGQGDIYSDVEYRFFSALFAGQLKDRLFELVIDQYNCVNTKAEMENTPIRVDKDRLGHDVIRKGKAGDKLPVNRLAKESTNLTDAVKYLVMRKQWLNIWGRYGKSGSILDP